MGPKLVLTVKNGKLAGKQFEFENRQKVVIGRGNDCKINLADDVEFLCVSRHHCLIDVAPPAVRVRDLCSRNGTHLNEMQIGRPSAWHLSNGVAAVPCWDYDLRNGDELRVGGTIFQVGISMPVEEELAENAEVTQGQDLCTCL
jgi:pSer/pThr/pTyr-binding forkhead associated (FHA) protein